MLQQFFPLTWQAYIPRSRGAAVSCLTTRAASCSCARGKLHKRFPLNWCIYGLALGNQGGVLDGPGLATQRRDGRFLIWHIAMVLIRLRDLFKRTVSSQSDELKAPPHGYLFHYGICFSDCVQISRHTQPRQ